MDEENAFDVKKKYEQIRLERRTLSPDIEHRTEHNRRFYHTRRRNRDRLTAQEITE
jgi:hypothetical protein